jgi:DNA-binding transcriptional ArsR family regulator
MRYPQRVSRPSRQHDAFTAIAEPTRRSILGLLEPEPLTVTAIVTNLNFTQPTISEHLSVLSNVGLVSFQQQGRERYYALRPEALAPVAQWLSSYNFWNAKLDALGAFLLNEGNHGSAL